MSRRVGDRCLAPYRGTVMENYSGLTRIHTDAGGIKVVRSTRVVMAESLPIATCPVCGFVRHTHTVCFTCKLLSAHRETLQ